jgi:hypothetical protein
MKKMLLPAKVASDDVYRVSAADVADKLIDRMARGKAPWLFSCSMFRTDPEFSLRALTRQEPADPGTMPGSLKRRNGLADIEPVSNREE